MRTGLVERGCTGSDCHTVDEIINQIAVALRMTDAAGWPRNQTAVYGFDEASAFSDMELLGNVSTRVKAAFPDIQFITCGAEAFVGFAQRWKAYREGMANVDVHVPNAEVYAAISLAQPDTFSYAHKHNKSIWWYTSGVFGGNQSVDHTMEVPPIRTRLMMGHATWKYRVDGCKRQRCLCLASCLASP